LIAPGHRLDVLRRHRPPSIPLDLGSANRERRTEPPHRETRRLPAALRYERPTAPGAPCGTTRRRQLRGPVGQVAGGDPENRTERAQPADRRERLGVRAPFPILIAGVEPSVQDPDRISVASGSSVPVTARTRSSASPSSRSRVTAIRRFSLGISPPGVAPMELLRTVVCVRGRSEQADEAPDLRAVEGRPATGPRPFDLVPRLDSAAPATARRLIPRALADPPSSPQARPSR
jgi:hypothetical protein